MEKLESSPCPMSDDVVLSKCHTHNVVVYVHVAFAKVPSLVHICLLGYDV